MPEPEDVTALKQFLGMVTYLAKFMPHLSEMTEPLRCLEDQNVEFQWLDQHSIAMNTIKKFLTEAPVLHYYDVSKPVTVQCNASQSGLGAVLQQDGQPVERVKHEEYIRVEPLKRDVFRQRITEDPDIQELIRVIKQGWPGKKKCPPAVQPYYDERGELIELQGLVFCGEQLVVSLSLRKDMLNQLHSSHIGTGGCVCRACEILYWPQMSAEIRDFVSRCTICQTYRPEQAREELQPHNPCALDRKLVLICLFLDSTHS